MLHDINLTLEVGQALGIIGETGSGKTTLGKMILRLQEPLRPDSNDFPGTVCGVQAQRMVIARAGHFHTPV